MRQKIGVMDSGCGGLTVMRRLRSDFPFCDIVYAGDTARTPYGSKSPEEVLVSSLRVAFHLEQEGCDLLVVACHTADSIALTAVESAVDIPVVGIINPSFKMVISLGFEHVHILATQSTLNSGVYQDKFSSVRISTSQTACPEFVSLVEMGAPWTSNPSEVAAVASRYLSEIPWGAPILLGCTHFPPLAEAIRKAAPCSEVLNPTQQLSSDLSSLVCPADGAGVQTFWVSGDPAQFRRVGSNILRHNITTVGVMP